MTAADCQLVPVAYPTNQSISLSHSQIVLSMEEGSQNQERSKDQEGWAIMEGSKNPEGFKHPEVSEDPQGSEKLEGSQNPEGPDNPEGSETQECCQNQADSKNQEGSDNPEESKNPKGSENPEGSENEEGSANPERSENLEGSENPEGSKNLEVLEYLELKRLKTKKRIKSQINCPKNRERKRKIIATFSWTMFVVDVGSDSLVGFDLLNRCHVRAGWTVLGLIWTPGCLLCIMKMLKMEEYAGMDCLHVIQYCVTSFLLFIFYLPMTFAYLIADIFRKTDTAKE